MDESKIACDDAQRRRVSFADSVEGGNLAEVREYTVVLPTSTFNECCKKVLALMADDDPGVRRGALSQIKGQVLRLSHKPRGSRVVEKALQVAEELEEQESLVTELHGHVLELALSCTGSQVLQSCLQFLPTNSARFIVTEIESSANSIAREEYGHGVLCGIIDHTPAAQMVSLATALLDGPGGAAELCKDVNGHTVLERLLAKGPASAQERVCRSLASAASNLNSHPLAVCLVKKALLNPLLPGREELVTSFPMPEADVCCH